MYDDASDIFGSTLTFLADHEYSDQVGNLGECEIHSQPNKSSPFIRIFQLMELERAFLLPPSAFNTVLNPAQSHIRHTIYGPSLTRIGAAKITVFPRLTAALAALKTANITNSTDHQPLAQSVQRELFYVMDALEAASCVLDNHVVWG